MAVPPTLDEQAGVTSSTDDSATSSEHDQEIAPERTRRGTPLSRVRVAAVIGVAILLCLGSLVYLVIDRGSVSAVIDEPAAAQSQSDREELMSTSEQFVLRVNTFGPQFLDEDNKMPEYVAQVKELLTAKFASGFEQQVGLAEETVAQSGAGRSAEVYATGVSELDDDSADVLVAGTLTNSYPDPKDPRSGEKRISFEPIVFRLVVSLVKTEGEWLVDDFNDIEDVGKDEPDDAPAPTELPTDLPTAPGSGGTR